VKIFLSWSGPRSRVIAEALNDWLPRIIQAVKPFYSPEIDKGAKWSGEIDSVLEDTSFGIICLTPENLDSTWIHFEAGALSKTKDALIWTFLHGLTPGAVPQPLGKFQHTVAKRQDTLQLLKTINRRLEGVGGEPLNDKLLEENFDMFWPQLERALNAASNDSESSSTTSTGAPRDQGSMLDEILELLRNQERRFSDWNVQDTSKIHSRKHPLVKGLTVYYPHLGAEEATNQAKMLGKLLSTAWGHQHRIITREDPPSLDVDFAIKLKEETVDLLLNNARRQGCDISNWTTIYSYQVDRLM